MFVVARSPFRHSLPTIAIAGAAVVAAAFALTVAAASGAEREVGAARPRTLAVFPEAIGKFVTDGPNLAWWIRARRHQECELKINVFNGATRRLWTLRPDLNCEVPTIIGTALAGTRVLFADASPGLSGMYASASTIAVGDRRARDVTPDEFGEDLLIETGAVGTFGYPARIAGGGGALAFVAAQGGWAGIRTGVWRVVGGKAVRVPYHPRPLVDLAVEGGRLATVGWAGRFARDWLPAWSPDGREIAWNHDGTIWLMQADGSNQHSLSSERVAEAESGPRWSPNAARLAFESGEAISLIERDGSNQRRLVVGGQPAWSPDGRQLVFVRADDLWLVDADGSGERRLTSDALKYTSRPEWSPDGGSIAVARADDIYVVDVATGAERDLTPGARADFEPTWSPDGTRIAFGTRDLVTGSIYTIRPDGTGLSKVGRRVEGDVEGEPAWSPDGRRIAYASRVFSLEHIGKIQIANADGSSQKTIADSPAPPAWSPDGKTVVAADDIKPSEYRPHTDGVFALDPEGGKPRLLATLKFPPDVEVRDSPTSKLLRRWTLPGVNAVTLSWPYLVAKARTCTLYSINTGARLGKSRCWDGDSLSGGRGVYSSGRRIFLVNLKSGHRSLLATAAAAPQRVWIEGTRVFWLEPYRTGSRLREIVLR